jgi:hypothetical protein
MSRATNTGSTGAPAGPSAPIHQAFSWLEEAAADSQDAQFAALSLDVCHGLQTCLSLVYGADQSSGPDADADVPPILGTADKERLLLLAGAAVRMLGDRAFERVEKLKDQAAKAGRNGGAA